MAKYESWSDAYERILGEVRVGMPGADEQTVYAAYYLRCQQWKVERGIRG